MNVFSKSSKGLLGSIFDNRLLEAKINEHVRVCLIFDKMVFDPSLERPNLDTFQFEHILHSQV